MQPSLRGSVAPELRGAPLPLWPALIPARMRAHTPTQAMALWSTPRALRLRSAAPGAAPAVSSRLPPLGTVAGGGPGMLPS
eukprot:15476197-Alexandrium_andersonii.AAC.1